MVASTLSKLSLTALISLLVVQNKLNTTLKFLHFHGRYSMSRALLYRFTQSKCMQYLSTSNAHTVMSTPKSYTKRSTLQRQAYHTAILNSEVIQRYIFNSLLSFEKLRCDALVVVRVEAPF